MKVPAQTSSTLAIERVFPHPPEKLWRALTESRLLAEWLVNNDFEPTVGRKFQFRRESMPNWDGVIDCKVLAIEPLKRLSYTWEAMGIETVVHWTLTKVDGGTHLRMEQSGFASEEDRAYKGAKYGWQNFLTVLDKVLSGF